VERICGELDVLKGQMAALQRHVFGKKTEKLPTVASELRGEQKSAKSKAERDEAAKKTRRERAARKAEGAPPPLPRGLPDDPRVREQRVPQHSLNPYDALLEGDPEQAPGCP